MVREINLRKIKMIFDLKTKELIAIGASVSANCQPCLQFHVSKAAEHGAIDSEIQEAIEVGKLVRRGAASKMDKFADELTNVSSRHEYANNEECECSK